MHREAKGVVEHGGDLDAAVEVVKGLLKIIDGDRTNIRPQALSFHEKFMKSMEEDPPEIFIKKIYAECCMYRV